MPRRLSRSSMGSAMVGLGLSTFSRVFLQGGVGVTVEEKVHRFAVGVNRGGEVGKI